MKPSLTYDYPLAGLLLRWTIVSAVLMAALVAVAGLHAQTQISTDVAGTSPFGRFGLATAISADGSRVVATDRTGSDTRVYDLVAGAWTQVGSPITSTLTNTVGAAVGISASGARVIVGEPDFEAAGRSSAGRARVFELVNGAWIQVGTDLTGPVAFDQLGWSVDVSADGSRIVVGVRQADAGMTDVGKALVYDLVGTTWTPVGSAIAGTMASEAAGSAVALSGDGQVLAVGSPFFGGFQRTGRVRVYTYDGTDWQQRGAELVPTTASVGLGASVDLSADGRFLAVGATNANRSQGLVRVYDFTGGNYVRASNQLDGQVQGDAFGRAVGLSADGTRLIVGSDGYDVGSAAQSAGRVYAYERVVDSWLPVGDPIDGAAQQESLGYSAAISADGTTLVAGARDAGAQFQGLWRAYSLPTSSYQALPRPVGFPVSRGQDFDELAAALAFSADGGVVATGAPQVNSANGGGFVRIHRYTQGTWTQVGQTLTGATGDDFGAYVALSDDGSVLAVGAPGANSANGTDNSGYAQAYTLVGNVWTALGNAIVAEVGADRCGEGIALSADGSRMAVGSPDHDNPASQQTPNANSFGNARVFDFANGTWTQVGGDIDGLGFTDRAGEALALSADGSRIVVGARTRLASSNLPRGAARVYDLIGTSWTQIGGDLLGAADFDTFGEEVAISDDGARVVVAAPRFDVVAGAGPTNEGRVYSYALVNGVWTEEATVTGTGTKPLLGRAIALSGDGNRLVVGSPVEPGTSSRPAGITQVYDFTGAAWTPMFSQLAGEAADDGFGSVAAISNDGQRIAVAAPGIDIGFAQDAGRVYFYTVSAAAPPLPVEMAAFSAVAKTRHVALAWTTAREHDASHFEVERSGDGAEWIGIGTVAAAGDTDEPTDYSLSDTAPLTGANYYRLRQVDVDGAEAFSDVEVVYYATPGASLADVRVYPNPAREFLTVAGLPDGYGPGGPEGRGEVTARLLDVSGREVGALGFGESRMRLTGVPSGVYALVIKRGAEREVRRVVVR